MPTIFEQYAPYRPELTASEQEMLDTSPDRLQAEMRVGLDRAEEQLRPWNYPEGQEITAKFPGVDPRGKMCQVDMAFSERLSKLQAALATRPPEVQQYVGGLFGQLKSRSTPLGLRWDAMQNDCINIRLIERAAKLAPTPEASEQLIQDAAARSTEMASIQRIDGFLGAMEYAAGLSDKAPDDRAKTFLNDILHAPIPEGVEAVRNAPAAAPAALSVQFQDFDHVVAQQFCSNPRNWGKSPRQMPPDIANAEAGAREVSKYAAATVDRTLQPLFEKMEKFSGGELCEQLDRAALITVDGKTVRSLMAEQYNGDPYQFNRWYRENVREMTNQIVSAGLMAGKRVETFVPDARGKLPAEPTQITKTGYEPSPLKKVTLNAWERHFAKYGFYKEKAVQAAEYQRVMEGREQMRSNYTAGVIAQRSPGQLRTENLFFGGYKQELGGDPQVRLADIMDDQGMRVGHGSFRVSRTAHVTACICQLVSKGYSVRDIMDPNKLQEERQAAGKLYMEKAIAGDTKWLGKTFYHGMKDLVDDARQVAWLYDLSDRQQLMEALPQYCDISRPIFDAMQEIEQPGTQEGFYLAAEADRPGHGIEFGKLLGQRAAGVGNIGDLARKELRASLSLSSPEQNINVKQELIHVLAGGAMRDLLKNDSQPDIFLRVTPDDVQMLGPGLGNNPTVGRMSQRLENDPASIQAVGRLAQSGQFQSQVSITKEQRMENGKPLFVFPTLSKPSLVRGEDGQLHLHVDMVDTPIPAMEPRVTPSKALQASLEKQQKAHEFHKAYPKPDPQKETRRETQMEAQMMAPKKAAAPKKAPTMGGRAK